MVVVCVARCVLYGVCCAHPLRRVLRKCATANRTSSFAPRYAKNGSGDVTGELPQARMLITATCVCVCVFACVGRKHVIYCCGQVAGKGRALLEVRGLRRSAPGQLVVEVSVVAYLNYLGGQTVSTIHLHAAAGSQVCLCMCLRPCPCAGCFVSAQGVELHRVEWGGPFGCTGYVKISSPVCRSG